MQQEAPSMQPEVPRAPRNPSNLVIILAVCVVILVAVVIYLWIRHTNVPVGDNTNPTRVGNNQNFTASGMAGQVEDFQGVTSTQDYINVDWLSEWVPSSVIGVEDPNQANKQYKVGTVKDGKYANYDLYLEVVPGLGYDYRHFIAIDHSPVYFDDPAVDIKIRGIDDIPESINFAGMDYVLKKNWIANMPFSEIKKVRKLFTNPKLGDVYLTEEGCFAVELPDHTAVTYDFIIPFYNKDSRVLEITYNDKSKNKDPYTYTKITGCGALCMYLAVIDENTLKPFERLTEAGKTSNGEILYELKDPNDFALVSLYNDKNTMPYISDANIGYQPQAKSKYTYSEFLSYHPLLYWKDPLGRWVEMKNDRFQLAAEMCKPVIYLYPKVQTEVAVEVLPNGGLTYTKPLYNNGWKVLAYPDGSLRNLTDGQNYPYLFWEGIGLNYPEQDSGFVVSKVELDSFLSYQLINLGLQGKEIMDFKNYWVPRLKGLGKPYLRITFLKKEQMDELAPLKMSVNPSSVIRVMMTAKGLDKFEIIPKQEIPPAPERKGFTVVEWGGSVLK